MRFHTKSSLDREIRCIGPILIRGFQRAYARVQEAVLDDGTVLPEDFMMALDDAKQIGEATYREVDAAHEGLFDAFIKADEVNQKLYPVEAKKFLRA